MVEITATEQNTEKRVKINENSLRDLSVRRVPSVQRITCNRQSTKLLKNYSLTLFISWQEAHILIHDFKLEVISGNAKSSHSFSRTSIYS